MKHAYLILCHKNTGQVNRLIKRLNGDNVCFFIHVDESCAAPREDFLSAPNIFYIKDTIHAGWGEFGQIAAVLKMLYRVREYSHKHHPFDYLSLISGQDFPVKTNREIEAFLQKNNGMEYFWGYRPSKDNRYGKRCYSRVYLRHRPLLRNKLFFRKLRTLYMDYMGAWFFSRKNENGFPPLFDGATWFTLTSSCTEYILDYIGNHPEYIALFADSFAGDELFFSTILGNSPYMSKKYKNFLRYVDFSRSKKIYPWIMRSDDFEMLTHLPEDMLFARKFDESVDSEILDRLENYLNAKEKEEAGR